jgi:hypothetical protein
VVISVQLDPDIRIPSCEKVIVEYTPIFGIQHLNLRSASVLVIIWNTLKKNIIPITRLYCITSYGTRQELGLSTLQCDFTI